MPGDRLPEKVTEVSHGKSLCTNNMFCAQYHKVVGSKNAKKIANHWKPCTNKARRAKQLDDELEFSRVPYSDPKQNRSRCLLVTVIEAGGGGGGGGEGWGHLPVLIIDNKK